MAVYKVIQDIEAEDRLLGPLTFKGLVYAGITALIGFINFRIMVTSSLGPIRWVVILILLMPMGLFGVLASPLGRDQPTEVWLLSRIRFMLKPRLRIWSQIGISDLVKITVPKKIERVLTKGYSEEEVSSRLQALATTLDSRGWAVKHVNVNLNAYAGYLKQDSESDRLIDTSTLVAEVPAVDVRASDDILDEKNNATAQNFQNLIVQADSLRKQYMKDKVKKPLSPEQYLQKEQPVFDAGNNKLHELHPMAGRGRQLQNNTNEPQVNQETVNRVTEANQAAKLELAQSGNDLSVASIARLANKGSDGEVVVSLH
jgi:hypothetical protein